ncbi:MAG TPA: hypothetical protein VMF69_15510 [Gemmataceae bacterium]|nr:hypothetical protein [Gemmataceae bacterium]
MQADSRLPIAEVELRVEAPDGVARRSEPVTCGLPWPRGRLTDVAQLRLEDEQKHPVPLQARALHHWPDGSLCWTLLDWQADMTGSARYRLRVDESAPKPEPAFALSVSTEGGSVLVDTGVARFRLELAGPFPFSSVTRGDREVIDPKKTRFTAEDEAGRLYEPAIDQLEVEETGPLRVAVRLAGRLACAGAEPLGDFAARLHFFAGSATVRFVLTLGNPRKAGHPGGLWDLGNEGSIYLCEASLALALPPAEGTAETRCSPETGSPLERFTPPLEIYQDSSGGANWKSHNHLNRRHVVPNSFRGYRLRAGAAERIGRRATPAVALARGGQELALAMEYFWQNFPKAIEAEEQRLFLRLFPRQYADVHELQGGEQKTHCFHVAFGPDAVTELPLAWCRAPALARATPSWYCSTGVFPYLVPKQEDANTAYLRLVDAAIEGDDTFEHKREMIDEYGWRHFGDVYGDHEAVFHKGAEPLASHYNNQYDNLAGFLYQFARSGDPRWWKQAEQLAGHVRDIDIYHTDRDKSAYNHGLFWHTYHYVDADTSTHRSYPRRAKVCGGGPGDEQNYATGLLFHYYLTGNPASREAAVGLAQWVIDMDDGRKTIFRWLDKGYSGAASASRTPLYHGPGRGAANSIAALLDGHRLTQEATFLAKADQLIRRCIHPADDIAARDLLDPENRWFYIMFLQSLGRYLDYKVELGQLDYLYAYARASLLHYARWMAETEYPYLEKPEKLEYPTETWAAQDMRKSEVFKYAAKHAPSEERERLLERAEFFFRYSTNTLTGMKTRTLSRPVVLLLSYGFSQAYFQQHPDVTAPPPAQEYLDFGTPEVFVPQKVRAKRRAVLAAGVVALAGLAGLGALLAYLLS